MRRHAKASSSGLNARKPSGHGASPPSGRLRLTILLATAAAFLLVPVAQAFATDHLTVNIASNFGAGGEVSSVGGFEGGGEFEGEPKIECSYASPGPKTGTCEDTMVNKGGAFEEELAEFGVKGVSLHATPAPGFAFGGWTEEEGNEFGGALQDCLSGVGATPTCFMYGISGGDAEVTATFTKAFPLTLKKSLTGTGEGNVISNPAGILCTTACPEKTANFEQGALVTLTASPEEDSVFTSWIGCVKTIEGTGAKGHKCTVEMTKALTVQVKFTKVQEVIASKDSKGNGFGTLTSSPGGISCGPACSSATAAFTDGSTVTVKAAPVASTSVFAGWTSCPGTVEGANCKVVASEEAKTATAKFNLIPQFTLTLLKPINGGGYGVSHGTGTVSSAPAGISCGPTCGEASASYNENKEVTLKAVAATGSEFGGWTGSGCSGTGTCTVKMVGSGVVSAEFK